MSKKGNLTVAIQAGGDALVNQEFMDARIVNRSINRLSKIADQLIVTTNKPENLEHLEGIEIVVDDVEKREEARYKGNALEGIRTALKAADNEFVAIVAGDMVFPSSNIIGLELKLLKQTGADLAIPHTRHGLEPFCAVYRKDACLKAVEKALADGARRCSALGKYCKTVEFNEAQALEADPRGGSFITLNNPSAIKRMEQRIKKNKFEKKADFVGAKKEA